jgi:undecaprenyl-diphosphatase
MELIIVKYINRLGHNSKMLNLATSLVCNILFLTIFWSLAGFLILFFNKDNGEKIFFTVAIALILHFAITDGIIKHLALKFVRKRNRPYIVSNEIYPVGRKLRDSSFPSSHVAHTLAILTVAFIYFPNFWPIMAAFILVMAFSRMHNGMHYLSDVIAGALLGILYGIGAIFIFSLL